MSGLCRIFACFFLLCLTCFAHSREASPPGFATDAEGYADPPDCIGCHQQQTHDWEDSDHGWAMREATPDNVLGDFNNTGFQDGEVAARFFRRDNRFFVNTEGEDGKPADFEISYTFGFSPLQQYLVAFPGGRLQSLTIAWDSRPSSEGGQRWFSLYPGERFAPNDALHWTGRYQNWNAMCADCHSTFLQKGYDAATDSFRTTWHEQNVGCQSCHGPAQTHVEWARKAKLEGTQGAAYDSLADIGLDVDLRKLGSDKLVEQCAFCHSRRQGLGVGHQGGESLFDSALPTTLRPDLYHADGQIDGEVYVYGSFTQSKMYQAGVTCTDCHNPHTTDLKVEGNGLCLQCHNPNPPKTRFPELRAADYDSSEHHHHTPGSTGAQCVNCHMPDKTYMQIDARRDHAIRIPRPDLSEQTDSPDACTSCHTDKTPVWAAAAIDRWFEHPQRRSHYGEKLHAIQVAEDGAFSRLAGLIGDLKQPAIVRATAIDQLPGVTEQVLPTLEQALHDDSPMVRASATSALSGQPTVERIEQLLPMLDDNPRAVRDQALRALAGVPESLIPKDSRDQFQSAMADYEQRLRADADLPGNRLNLATFLQQTGRSDEAKKQYLQALVMDSYFLPARVNMATMASQAGDLKTAESVLRDGLALDEVPASDRGNLAYLLALLLVEEKQPREALKWFSEAVEDTPGNIRIRYNYGLLLMQTGQLAQAAAVLETALEQAPSDYDVLYGLAYLYASTGQPRKAMVYAQRLQQLYPGDRRVQQLVLQLQAGG